MDEVFVTLQNSINSDGLWYPSISIYYSGCDKPVKCPECHNPELQQYTNGFRTTNIQLIKDIESKLNDWLNTYKTIAICYLGGEPLSEWNRDSVLVVSKYFKLRYRNRICNVIYTWRYLKDLYDLKEYLSYMDYGVLGDFQINKRNTNFIPSSSNQYIYDFNNKTKLEPIAKGH